MGEEMSRIAAVAVVLCLLSAGVGQLCAAPVEGRVVEKTTYRNVRIDGEPFVVATHGNLAAVAGLTVAEQLELVLFLVNGSGETVPFDPGEITAFAEQKKRLTPLYVFSREDVARHYRFDPRPAEVGEALARVLSTAGGNPRAADWSSLGAEFREVESRDAPRSSLARETSVPPTHHAGGLVIVVHTKAKAWLIRVPFGGAVFEFRFTP